MTDLRQDASEFGRTEPASSAMRAAAAVIRTAFDPMALCTRDGTPLVANRGYDELFRMLGRAAVVAIAARAIDDLDRLAAIDEIEPAERDSIRGQAGEIDVESNHPVYVVALQRTDVTSEPALSRATAREVQHDLRHAMQLLSAVLGAEDDQSGPLNALTAKEEEVLGALVAGYRVPTIARDLHVSQSTVRSHLRSIFQKYGVHSQAALIEKLLANDRRGD